MATRKDVVIGVVLAAVVGLATGSVVTNWLDEDPPSAEQVSLEAADQYRQTEQERRRAATAGFIRALCMQSNEGLENCEFRIDASDDADSSVNEYRVIYGRVYDLTNGGGSDLPDGCTGLNFSPGGVCNIRRVTATDETFVPPAERFAGS